MTSVDRYDALRCEWIKTHRGWSTIQDRRQNRLEQVIRRRQRVVTGAVPDPHDDVALPPIWARVAKSPASRLEWLAVNIAALIIPLGWPLGWALHCATTRAIPNVLRAYPIAAMLAAGGFLGLLTVVCYDPGDGPTAIITDAWVPMQLAAVPVVAGVYGVLDGWLAIPGSLSWWPLAPRRRELTSADATEILGSCDLTGPGVIDAKPLLDEGERRL